MDLARVEPKVGGVGTPRSGQDGVQENAQARSERGQWVLPCGSGRASGLTTTNGRGIQEGKDVTRPEGRGLEPWEGAQGTAMSGRVWPRCSPEP